MLKSKIAVDINQFPAEIQSIFSGANVYDSSSHSNAAVYYCDTGFYVKVDSPGELAREAELGRLFHSWGLGVEVAAYISRGRDFLATRSAAGKDLTHCLDETKKCCEMLAKALRTLHEQPVAGLPVSTRYQRYMDSADGDLSGGYYDESVLMNRFPVGSKQEAWEIMQASRSWLKPDTLIHGDACLSNILFCNGKLDAFIDLNMSGVGDRHIDLYWAVWSMQDHLKTDRYTDYLLDAYGRDCFDYEMLRVVAAFELFG